MRRPRLSKARRAGAAIIAALGVFAAPLAAPVHADEIRLTDPAGGFAVAGEMLGFDGENIRVATDAGVLTLALAGLDCAGACPGADYVPALRLSGAARLASLVLPALIEAYALDTGLTAERIEGAEALTYRLTGPGALTITLKPSAIGDGFADLLAGEADILLADRPLAQEELALARDAGLGDLTRAVRRQVFALDALVPAVAPSRLMEGISLPQLIGVYSGRLTDWAQLGQPPGPIHAYLGAIGDGQAQLFLASVLGRAGRVLSPQVRRLPAAALAEALMGDADGIALMPFGEIGNTLPLPIAGRCGITMAAVEETIRAEDYPLTLPIYLYAPRRIQHPAVRAFLAWLPGREAQLVLRRAGVIGPEPVPIAPAAAGARYLAAIAAAGTDVPLAELQRMAALLAPRQRLSPTFRFAEGATGLDPASSAVLDVLAERLAEGRYTGKGLMLIGFSDARGPGPRNLALSLGRAQAVEAALLQRLGGTLPDGVALQAEALGEALPVACDDTIWGRERNRRVELWMDE